MSLKFLLIGSEPESLINFRGPLIKSLIDKGIQVHVAAPYIFKSSIIEDLKSIGVIVHEVSLKRTGINPFSDLRTIYQLWHLMKEINPDFYLGYTHKPAIYGNLAAWIAKVPSRFALITGLGYAFLGKKIWLNYIVKFLYQFSLSNTHKVIFQNQDDELLFFNLGILKPIDKKTAVVNGSGIDIESFKETPFPNEITFLLIARLLQDKGIREYFKASRIVKKEYPNVNFALVGWIDENPSAISKNELQERIDSGDINFYGRLEDVKPAISNCSVYVLPSYREGTPRTVLEAMAMGRPIITTNAPGCKETVVDGKNGFLVPVKDENSLAKAMLKFIENPNLISEMGAQSRIIATEKYDVKKVNENMFKHMGLK